MMLEGDVSVIYGAAGGIGHSVVERFLTEGASVVAVDRNEERLAALVRANGENRLLAIAADVVSWQEAVRVATLTQERFGSADNFVSCVGVYDHARPLVSIPGEDILAACAECFATNVASVIMAVKALLEQLVETQGRVVLTSSAASYLTSGGGVLYTASKHAVSGLISQLAYELAPKIRVNGIAPGVAQTVMSGLAALSQAPQNSLLSGSEKALPLAIVPQTADYAGIYALLASRAETVAMTGSTIIADSGLLIRGIGQVNGGGSL
jgi:NAD(P)-dependent dehydrogenase (short-subunit alcohol dehydrogenase family)